MVLPTTKPAMLCAGVTQLLRVVAMNGWQVKQILQPTLVMLLGT